MVRRKKLLYQEGTSFAVPLRSGGYARGVIARANGEGGAFGYFFGPKIGSPEEATTEDMKPERAILVGMFGDLGLVKGKWPILGKLDGWKRSDWSMPPLIRISDNSIEAWLSYYDENTFAFLREEEVDPSLCDRYPYDRDMGYGAVEIRLSKLLG